MDTPGCTSQARGYVVVHSSYGLEHRPLPNSCAYAECPSSWHYAQRAHFQALTQDRLFACCTTWCTHRHTRAGPWPVYSPPPIAGIPAALHVPHEPTQQSQCCSRRLPCCSRSDSKCTAACHMAALQVRAALLPPAPGRDSAGHRWSHDGTTELAALRHLPTVQAALRPHTSLLAVPKPQPASLSASRGQHTSSPSASMAPHHSPDCAAPQCMRIPPASDVPHTQTTPPHAQQAAPS